MSDPVSTQARWRGMRVVAATAAVLTAAALSVIDARAQSNDRYDTDRNSSGYEQSDDQYPDDIIDDQAPNDRGSGDRRSNDRGRDREGRSTSDDGSYPSDSRGGYQNTDDEDGYDDGQDAPDVSYFYDELENDGDWISHPTYGQVWRPRNVDYDWRPYTRGTWANTEEHGWYWVSDEPFGWATYHYGRWFLDWQQGWLWVPGTRWAPAWVTWRYSDDYIGWAPLPPEAYWRHGSGLIFNARLYEGIRYRRYWSFVEYRHITAPRIHTYCAPRPRLRSLFRASRPTGNYGFVNRRIINRGVPVLRIEAITRTRFAPWRIRATDDRSHRIGHRDNDVLNIFRPKLTRRFERDHRRDPRPHDGRPHVERKTFRDVDRRPTPAEIDKRRRHPPVPGIGVPGRPDRVRPIPGREVLPPEIGRPGIERRTQPRTLPNTTWTPNINPGRAPAPDGSAPRRPFVPFAPNPPNPRRDTPGRDAVGDQGRSARPVVQPAPPTPAPPSTRPAPAVVRTAPPVVVSPVPVPPPNDTVAPRRDRDGGRDGNRGNGRPNRGDRDGDGAERGDQR